MINPDTTKGLEGFTKELSTELERVKVVTRSLLEDINSVVFEADFPAREAMEADLSYIKENIALALKNASADQKSIDNLQSLNRYFLDLQKRYNVLFVPNKSPKKELIIRNKSKI